jgi:hypothetical protein
VSEGVAVLADWFDIVFFEFTDADSFERFRVRFMYKSRFVYMDAELDEDSSEMLDSVLQVSFDNEETGVMVLNILFFEHELALLTQLFFRLHFSSS